MMKRELSVISKVSRKAHETNTAGEKGFNIENNCGGGFGIQFESKAEDTCKE